MHARSIINVLINTLALHCFIRICIVNELFSASVYLVTPNLYMTHHIRYIQGIRTAPLLRAVRILYDLITWHESIFCPSSCCPGSFRLLVLLEYKSFTHALVLLRKAYKQDQLKTTECMWVTMQSPGQRAAADDGACSNVIYIYSLTTFFSQFITLYFSK